MVEVLIPEAFVPLLEPRRYKVLYGGRGGAKSWQIARILLVLAAQRKLRIMCAREIQNSIQESVHSLLVSQINLLGLDALYDVQKTVINGKNGSEFFFSGLKHKIDSIKSTEGVDICWVEEAHTVSKSSWDKLTPTIRKPGSEIWISFNPELDDDPTYKRFVLNPPADAWVQLVSYKDNPWFTDELKAEMRETRARSEDDYQHIWLGLTRQTLDGAVYARELREAREEGRITKVPYDLSKAVDTYWDLGFNDATAIWFIQRVGMEDHVIDYYENRQQHLAHYVGVLQEKKYNYGTDYMPHDAASNQLGAPSIEKQFRDLTQRIPVIVPRGEVAVGINACRMAFPQLWFDEEKCADGLQMLRRYCYEVDEDNGEFSRRPIHDESSHAADALRAWAMAKRTPRNRPQLELVRRKPQLTLRAGGSRQRQAWMGR